MKTRFGKLFVALAAILVFGVGSALTAANSVAQTGAGRSNTTISANTLKPSSCAALTLTTVVAGTNGTNGADLLAGSSGNDNMTARNGSDCVLGGAGNDSIDGGGGTDICIGGSGTNTFTACEAQL